MLFKAFSQDLRASPLISPEGKQVPLLPRCRSAKSKILYGKSSILVLFSLKIHVYFFGLKSLKLCGLARKGLCTFWGSIWHTCNCAICNPSVFRRWKASVVVILPSLHQMLKLCSVPEWPLDHRQLGLEVYVSFIITLLIYLTVRILSSSWFPEVPYILGTM